MRRKPALAGLGAAMAFLSLAVFAAPGEPDDDANGSVENTAQVWISNIPREMKNGAPAYKIFIQLSTGITAKAGYVAKGEALIGGAGSGGEHSVVIDLKNPDGMPWNNTGHYYLAIIISPKEVYTAKDISVHGGEKRFSPPIQHIAWAPGLINLPDFAPAQVEELFEGIIKPDTDIIKHDALPHP